MEATLGFIGCGKMGSAIIRGIGRRKGLKVVGYDTFEDQLELLHADTGLIPAESEVDVAISSDFIILAVKPNQVAAVLEEIVPHTRADTCIISIAAGVTLASLEAWSRNKCPVVRVMPNTPTLVGKGVFAVCLEDERLDNRMREFVLDLFRPLGQVHVMTESMFDAFTGLIGSGPAYVFHFMEALIEAGVYQGFPRDLATEMVYALVDGSATLARESDYHVSQLREMVTSPAGTTGRALAELDRRAVRTAVIDAVDACCKRSKELG